LDKSGLPGRPRFGWKVLPHPVAQRRFQMNARSRMNPNFQMNPHFRSLPTERYFDRPSRLCCRDARFPPPPESLPDRPRESLSF
jgi:hypothetical protein